MKLIYRIRTVEKLLGSYKELENQEIYFASPEQLNDPMEGYSDILWVGDAVVWKNLLKNYLLCFEYSFSYVTIVGDLDTKMPFPTFKTANNYPTGEYKIIYEEICLHFFSRKIVNDLILFLADRGREIRRDELLFYIRLIHVYAINAIVETYKKHKLLPHDFKSFPDKANEQRIIKSLSEIIQIEFDQKNANFADISYSVVRNISNDLDFLQLLNFSKLPQWKGKFLLFVDYPLYYINNIKKFLYPPWYAACFMEKCTNPSVWSHYGDGHKGVSLVFKVKNNAHGDFIELYSPESASSCVNQPYKIHYEYSQFKFSKISYSDKYQEIDFFKSLGQFPIPHLMENWYYDGKNKSSCVDFFNSDRDKWRELYWKNFESIPTTKLKDWEYECEHRLILMSMGLFDYENEVPRNLKYKFEDLEGIIFGLNTSYEDKLKIADVILGKCKQNSRADFKFYQAFYDQRTGKIGHHHMSLVKLKD